MSNNSSAQVCEFRRMAGSIVIGGPSGAADLQAVLQVAHGQTVVLDAVTADRIKKESPSPKDFKQEDQAKASNANGQQALEVAEARAGILCRLISLAHGSTKLRLAVLQYYVEILNAHLDVQLPSAATDKATLRHLADAAAGSGVSCQNGKSTALSEALQQQQIATPGLSQHERTVLQSGQWISLGVAAVVVQKARQLLLGATAVAALSAEALQTQVRPLGKRVFALLMQHHATAKKTSNHVEFQAIMPCHSGSMPCCVDFPVKSQC